MLSPVREEYDNGSPRAEHRTVSCRLVDPSIFAEPSSIGELFRKVVGFYSDLGKPIPPQRETALSLSLTNGSRVVSLPASPDTIRGYSAVDLLVIDEAAMVPDELFVAVNPMLAVSRGRLVCLSTPLGKRGWFFESWNDPQADWERVKVTAEDCPRIAPEFLEEQKKSLGERWFRQEYLCSF